MRSMFPADEATARLAGALLGRTGGTNTIEDVRELQGLVTRLLT